MARVKRLRRETPVYLIPIIMGLAGLLFSSQLEDPVAQGTVVLLCLGIPLFAGGNLLARFNADRSQRALLMAGMAMLLLGAVVIVSGYSESLVARDMVTVEVGEVSRYLGMGSLLLGLLVVLLLVVRSQALIDELSDRFRHVADHMAEGFILTDVEGKIVLVNPSLVSMAGISEEEMIGRTTREIIKEVDAKPVGRRAAQGTNAGSVEFQMELARDGDERHFWVNGTPIYDQRGRQIGGLATVRDITERHRMARRLEKYAAGLQQLVEEQTEKLRSSEQRMRDLLLHMDEGFLTLDRDFKIRFANERLKEMLEVTNDAAIVGASFFDLVEPSGRYRLRVALENTQKRIEKPRDQEYAFVRNDGGRLAVKVAIAPIEDASEDEPCFSLVVTDVSELKEMQRQLELRAGQLEEANKELRDLDRAKDVFLSNVSHELRTPLSTLQGYIEMLESGSLGELDGPKTGALKVMSRNAERLSKLITEMIEFSRMEIRGIKLNKTLFDCRRLVQEGVESAHPAALKKDISITTFLPDDMPPIWGDREKLCQVLGILLSNAIKFSRQASLIQVQVSKREGGDVALAVADTGIGIDPAYQERIFSKFYQVDSSLTRQYQGTGIGLSIAKNVVEAHGGHIELASVQREGSTFTVVLPKASFEPTQIQERTGMWSGRRVVILEKDAEFAESLARAFEHLGARADTFDSGYDGIQMIRRSAVTDPVDVVAIDEALTDLSGADAAAEIKLDLDVRDLPIVLLYSGDAEEAAAIESRFSGIRIVAKPFAADELLETMEHSLRAGVDEEPILESDGVFVPDDENT